MKKKMLWVSLCTPYEKVCHAGGKTLYSHIQRIQTIDKFELKVVSFCKYRELQSARQSLADADIDIIMDKPNKFWEIMNFENRFNAFNRYAGYLSNSRAYAMKKELHKIQKSGYEPDIIVLHWTEMVVLTDFVKKLFPGAKVVSIEEDVSFLKRERRYKAAKRLFIRFYHFLRYKKSIQKECEWLKRSDLVVVLNNKDKMLLVKEGVKEEQIYIFPPTFNDMYLLKRNKRRNDILFWGAMSRKENSDSALWFIYHVMPLLEDVDVRFVVIGANPPDKLKKMSSDRIVIKGYVESADRYFSESLCMVVPLLIGAGIKVKTIEGLSSGIPVISNHIGVEGINIVRDVHYIHAETASEFAEAVKKVLNEEIDVSSLSENAKRFTHDNYDEDASTKKFVELCEGLVYEKTGRQG